MDAMRLPIDEARSEDDSAPKRLATNHRRSLMNTNTQTHKVAIVTGASRGIGASIAKRLAREGITVIVNYAGREADANQVVEDIKAEGGKATAIQADVAVPAQVAALKAALGVTSLAEAGTARVPAARGDLRGLETRPDDRSLV